MNKNDAYQVITDRICELLEKGEIPWKRPWNNGDEMPKNLISKKEYRGINPFILGSMRFTSSYWLTFRQAKELGGYVKAGEKGTPVVFWKRIYRDSESGTLIDEGEIQDFNPATKWSIPKTVKESFVLRYYTVFNLTQCDGIPEDKVPPPNEKTREFNPIQAAERIVNEMSQCPRIEQGESQAYYRPSSDTVNMPNKELFKGDEEYYSTLFHELTHSTGHSSRLNRKEVTEATFFGSHSYSKEELCAEMGAAFLCGKAGIVERTIDNSAAYVQGWLRKLRSDRKFLVHAASQAQRAADFILNKHYEDLKENENE